ncbi:MAG TPA: HupE/UreJ family protein [Hyphomicrobiaceae bacterium]|jgi:urease accessory protein|nr:HupE/UreJ family protein [Hyphomicrobiaceae bacterium]
MRPYLKIILATASAAGSTLAPPAFAHHVMGGELPLTVWQGLLSGLGHPIIGVDHLAFIVGVGLMSQFAGRIAMLPFLFILGTVLGCFAHVQGYTLPWVEPAIALSIAVAAAVVGTHAKASPGALAALFVGAGVVHGYAYGESIVGAETQPLAAYIIGFGAIQYLLALGSGVALRIVVARDYLGETVARRMAGGGLALAALLAFANVALAG